MNYIIYFFFQLNEIREVVDGELGFAASQERDLKQDEQVTVINVSLSTPFPLFFFLQSLLIIICCTQKCCLLIRLIQICLFSFIILLQAFLFINSKKVVGCVIAVPITQVFH